MRLRSSARTLFSGPTRTEPKGSSPASSASSANSTQRRRWARSFSDILAKPPSRPLRHSVVLNQLIRPSDVLLHFVMVNLREPGQLHVRKGRRIQDGDVLLDLGDRLEAGNDTADGVK